MQIQAGPLYWIDTDDYEALLRVAEAAKMRTKAYRLERISAHLHHWFVVSHASDERCIRALAHWEKELKQALGEVEHLL